jgi:hypothetical protein
LTILLLLTLPGCGKKIDKQIRDAVRHFDGAELPKDSVEVIGVQQSQNAAVAEVQVTTAFKLIKKDGKWVVDEVRIGENRWEKADHILASLHLERVKTTEAELNAVSEAVERYREETGSIPQAGSFRELVDQLAPAYLTYVIRRDSWDKEFRYEISDKDYSLISAGPDGRFLTADDVIKRSR